MWILLGVLIVLIYLINQHFFSYWSKRGVPFKTPTFLLGELGGLLLKRPTYGEYLQKIYEDFKNEKIVGLYFSYRPALVIKDPLLIQDVLIKNFTSFHDRGFPVDEESDPLSGHLFSISGQKWRNLRVKLSPTFTSGKLKSMFPTIRDCATTLLDHISNNINNGNDTFDTRDLLARYTTSVISSVAFGIENDCINERDNSFRKMGLKYFEPSLNQIISDFLTVFMPELSLKLKIKITPDDVEEFFMSVVKQTIEHREKNKDFERKDFMQLMIQLKNQGFLSSDKNESDDEGTSEKLIDTRKLTFNEVAAQSFVFFIAGRCLLEHFEV